MKHYVSEIAINIFFGLYRDKGFLWLSQIHDILIVSQRRPGSIHLPSVGSRTLREGFARIPNYADPFFVFHIKNQKFKALRMPGLKIYS